MNGIIEPQERMREFPINVTKLLEARRPSSGVSVMNQYSVGFLIPKDANRILGDDGWEFESNLRLPVNIESLIETQFSIGESSSSFSAYDGPSLKVDVFKDECGEIENIYFRFYDDATPELPGFLKEVQSSNQLEFFVP